MVEEGERKDFIRDINDEMKRAFIDYSMSVIMSRALPDVRDGLKPVHRRILYGMNEMGMGFEKPYKKSARIVGDILGKYHPHGDQAVYDSLVRMAQDFSLRYPLVSGQGNFGSIDGDSPAAMRYCVTGDSLVLTDQGIQEIKDISKGDDTVIDMGILNYQHDQKQAVKFFNSGKHPTIHLVTEQGYEIEGSYNHPVLTWSFDHGIPHIKWKALENITPKDFIVLSRKSFFFNKKEVSLQKYHPIVTSKKVKDFALPKKMNKELAFLLGAFVSEGSYHQGQLLFNNTDDEFYSKVKNAVYNQFNGVKLYERKMKKCGCTEFSLYYKKIVDFLINIGLKPVRSEDKEIPFTILQSKQEYIASFLSGLFEGDGSVIYKIDKRHGGKALELTYTSKSKKLIIQLKTLLLNFGIVTTNPYVDKRNQCYKLIISDISNIKRFKDMINFSCSRKRSIIENIETLNSERMSKNDFIPFLDEYLRRKYRNEFLVKNNLNRYNKLEKNYSKISEIIDVQDKKILQEIIQQKYFFNKVKKIRRTNQEKTVYSLRVDSPCHSYIANGFINHNTEVKMAKITKFILQDIDKETVEWRDNFDGSLKEPVVLPAILPNLLINGSSGIAVGMATNMAPHNLSEVIDGTIRLIDNPDLSMMDLVETIKGPDFPTGGLIYGRGGILEAYSTGRGLVRIRARTSIEGDDRKKIIVNELPYQVNKSELLKTIASLVKDKRLEGISDLRDESDRKGMRIVIELKRDAIEDVVLNQLFEHTQLQSTFGILNLAIVKGAPKILTLKEIIQHFIEYRIEIITKRTTYDLMKAKEKMHILEGLMIALKNIDEVIEIIRKSKEVEEAKTRLMQRFKLSELQAKAILEMRLQKLVGMEIAAVEKEYNEVKKLIADLEELLNSKEKILVEIKRELLELKEKFGDQRRTEIVEGEIDIEIEDLIPRQEVVVTITATGYIKRLPTDTYRTQHRGGKGLIGIKTKEEDVVIDCFVTNTHDYLMFFTNLGRTYWLKAYKIPEAERHAKGKAIINLLPRLEEGEKVETALPVHDFDDKHYLVFATTKGTIKKTVTSAYGNIRVNGIRAINLAEGDELMSVVLTDGSKTIMMASSDGQASRFNETEIRGMGRVAHGVIGMRLHKNDSVVAMTAVDEAGSLLTLTENGFGKRSPIAEYRQTHRGSKGVRTIVTNERNGKVIFVSQVTDEEELIITTMQGMTVRIPVRDIRSQGRNTMGVRIMRLNEGDKVVSVTKVMAETGEEACAEPPVEPVSPAGEQSEIYNVPIEEPGKPEPVVEKPEKTEAIPLKIEPPESIPEEPETVPVKSSEPKVKKTKPKPPPKEKKPKGKSPSKLKSPVKVKKPVKKKMVKKVKPKKLKTTKQKPKTKKPVLKKKTTLKVKKIKPKKIASKKTKPKVKPKKKPAKKR